jgi:shikimate kinase
VSEHLLLVGMMGAGKSTTGRILAERLGRPSVDTDEEVGRRAGSTVSEIFSSQGESAFRGHESEALRAALASDVASVVSVGGGAVLDPGNRAAMRASGAVVWLRARPDTLWRRVAEATDRPLLAGSTGEERRAELERIDADRRALYEGVATVVVAVDDLTPSVVADRVIVALRAAGRAPEVDGGRGAGGDAFAGGAARIDGGREST